MGLKGQEQAMARGSLGGQQESLAGEQRPARNLSGRTCQEGSCNEMTKDKQRASVQKLSGVGLGHRLRICWKSGPVLWPDVVTHEGHLASCLNGTHLKGRGLEAYA